MRGLRSGTTVASLGQGSGQLGAGLGMGVCMSEQHSNAYPVYGLCPLTGWELHRGVPVTPGCLFPCSGAGFWMA